MARTDADIANQALQELGHDTVTGITGDTSKAGIAIALSYLPVRDRLLEEFFWRFATKRRAIARNSNSRETLLHEDGGVWTVSPSQAGEYYMAQDAKKSVKAKPDDVFEDDSAMTADGTLGSLNAGEWAWGDNDSLGFSTLYVRLSDDADPDSKQAADEDFLEAAYDDPDFGWLVTLSMPGDMLIPIRANNIADGSGLLITDDTISNLQPSSLIEAEWEEEDGKLLTNESAINLIYMALVSDPEKWPPTFVKIFALMLAVEICYTLTDNRSLKKDLQDDLELAIRKGMKKNAMRKNSRQEKNLTSNRPNTPWQGVGR